MPHTAPRPVGRIRDRRTFGVLRRAGTRRRSGPVVITMLADPTAACGRVAYAVNRSVGGAVERNRLRRRLRAIMRQADLGPGAYLVAASARAAATPYDELAAHVRRALDQPKGSR